MCLSEKTDCFVDLKLIHIVINERTSNVIRPAIDILGRLVVTDPGGAQRTSNSGRLSKISRADVSDSTASADPNSETSDSRVSYGFDRMYDRMQLQPTFFEAMTAHVEDGDLATGLSR